MLSYVLLIVSLGLLWLFLKKNSRMPPGPVGLPILGYLPFFKTKFLERELDELSKKYGPVMTVAMGVHKCVVVSDYQILKDFFAKNETTGRPDLFSFKLFSEGYPEGIVMASGHEWQTSRRFTLRHLKDCGMGKCFINDVMQVEVEDMSGKIKDCLESPVRFGSLLDLATMNVISNVLIGKRTEKFDDNFAREIQNMFDAEKYFLIATKLCLLPTCIFNLIPGSVYGLKSMRHLSNWLRKYAEKHYDKAFNSYDSNHKRHFFDYFISEVLLQPEDNPDKIFTKEGLSSLFFELFNGGLQTTSVTMKYAIYYLARYPDIQQKVYEEIKTECGTSARVQLGDKSRLLYLEAFLNEVQRVADIVPLSLFHLMSDDAVLQGYTIPKGTIIIPSLYSCHHDSKYWKDPHQFNPGRFIDEQGKLITNLDGFAPFSVGKRRCPGEALARSELFLFTANLVQEFSIHAPPGGFELERVPGAILHPVYADVLVKIRSS